MRRRALVCALGVAGCGAERARGGADPGDRGDPPAMQFAGACDASGAVWLRGSLIVVADDEDNRLRIYDAAAPGRPVEVIDTSPSRADPDGKDREMDLEAAARVGDRIYWLASHGRKKSGKPAPSRLRIFATDVVAGRLSFVGTVYAQLVDDLSRVPGVDLAAAAARPPGAEGGLNIEGLDATPEGQLLLGFRSPLVGGRALVVPIENPAALVERGERAVLGAPRLFDLGGRGVRAMESDGRRRHWILAGAPGGDSVESRLYLWQGTGEPRWLEGIRFDPLNPEAMTWVGGRLLVLSDDGERPMAGGSPCKKLNDSAVQRFRATWIDPRAALVSP